METAVVKLLLLLNCNTSNVICTINSWTTDAYRFQSFAVRKPLLSSVKKSLAYFPLKLPAEARRPR